jgi:hypothetical protein
VSVVCFSKLTIGIFRGACHLFTISPPRRSRRMQGLSPEHLDDSQPSPTGTPEGSPHQTEVPVVTPPHGETSDVPVVTTPPPQVE